MSDTLSVLIIGCGRIAGGYADSDAEVLTHAGAYARHPGYRLAACVDPDPDSRAAFQSRWTIPAGFADLDSALAASHFDIASVCSPTNRHAGDLTRLLASGVRGVLAEKPIAGTLADAETLAEAWAADGRPVAVNHLRRFDASMADLRRDLAAGTYGSLRSILGLYGKGVLNNGTHLIDLIQFLTDAEPRIIHAGTLRLDDGAPEPSVDALLMLPGGVPVHLATHDSADCSLFELTLVTARAVLQIERNGFSLRIRKVVDSARFPGYREIGEPIIRDTALGQAMPAAVDQLYQAVRTGAPLASTLGTALSAMRLCHDLLESARARLEIGEVA